MTKVYINGKFVDPVKAKVSVFDRGFMYGDGVFETMRGYAGVVFKLDEHLDRLLRSLKIMKIIPPYSKRCLKVAIYETLKANRHCEGTKYPKQSLKGIASSPSAPRNDRLFSAYIKVIVTRGEGRFGISHKDIFSPNVVITAKDFEGYPGWMFDVGLSANITGVQNEGSITSRIKTLNYLPYILARADAQDRGFDEAILTNTKGFITEAATSNIFIVKKSRLITPSIESGILPGITRGVIINIAKKMQISVKEKLVTRRELLGVDEIFLTNSLAEVLPVTRVDSKPVGTGLVGDITKLLRISYQKTVIREVA
ncbi:MAG: aminotransferase class IV [Candidatus Omnitrophica bacterium]|nr:aminotransferase class IV [Candidatus Omnitrophota bacterium]